MPFHDRFGGRPTGQRWVPFIFAAIFLLSLLHIRDDYAHITPLYWKAASLKWSHQRDFITHNGETGHQWNYTRDANNLVLTHGQCERAFPGFAEQIDKSVLKHTAPARRIKRKHLDNLPVTNGTVRAMIYDQQLYVIKTGGPYDSRTFATLLQIHRALVSAPESVPNIEFAFAVDDQVKSLPQWAVAKAPTDGETWLMPDFGFWSWPETRVGSYSEARRKAHQVEDSLGWADKISKLAWRGTTEDIELQPDFVEAAGNMPWTDIRVIDWPSFEGSAPNLSMDERCRFKYLVHAESSAFSGRLKYLQLCKSVIIARPPEWTTPYTHLLKANGPEQNYLEANGDWSDLESKVRHLSEWDSLGERIASNSVATFRERYLTPAAEACYWRRLFQGWAEVVDFQPEFYDIGENGVRSWRGVPFESYILERRLHSNPYK